MFLACMHTHDRVELLQEAIKVFMWNEQACLHTEMSFSQHNINKQADTGKHNAFKGAPVQIRSSEAKHKASKASADLDSDVNIKKSPSGVRYSWFCTVQRGWRAGQYGMKGAGTKEIHPRQTTIPSWWRSRCQTTLGQISQTSWVVVCKRDVKENKSRTKIGRWSCCQSFPLCCPLLCRAVQKPELRWPLDPPFQWRAQASIGPRTLTFYLRNSDNSSPGSHSLLWPVPHSQTTQSHHIFLCSTGEAYSFVLDFQTLSVSHKPPEVLSRL